MMKLNAFQACIVALSVAATLPSLAEAPLKGDASVGKQLANEGAGSTAPCMSCHGSAGAGIAANDFPRIAGYSEYYLRKQLQDFHSGRRKHAVMQPMAYGLNDQQIADVAAYYAELPTPPFPDPPAVDAKILAAGEALAERGDAARQLVACANCHGPLGIGLPPAIPSLAGQTREYISAQLKAWQRGDRSNDDGGLMAAVANGLDDADIAAVAAYYATVRPARLEP
jgi:cytochrome c553